MDAEAAVSEVLAAEELRCRLIGEGDFEGLAGLLRDELVHIHANGASQDKGTYLNHVKSRPRRSERRDLRVQVFGDTAIMVGQLLNIVEGQSSEGQAPLIATQVWVRDEGGWKQAAFQATRLAEP